MSFRWSRGLTAAVIKDARRRARRRRLRMAVVVLGAGLAAAIYVESTGHDAPPPNGSTVRPVPLGSFDVALGGTAIQGISADDSVWILTCRRDCSAIQHSFGELVRVSSRSGRVIMRIPVSSPQAFAVGAGAVWIVHFWSGTVTRVATATGKTTKTVSLVLPSPYFSGDRRFLPYSISIANGTVWVATARGWLAEIVGATGRLVAMFPAPHESTGQVAAGARGTWVAESTRGLGLIRRRADRLKLRSITNGRNRPLAIDQVAIGGGRLWSYGITTRASSTGTVLGSAAVLTAVDERTGTITRQLPVPAGPYDLVYGDGALFLANAHNGRLLRVNRDYTTHQLHPIRPAGRLLTVTRGALWTATKAGALQRRALP